MEKSKNNKPPYSLASVRFENFKGIKYIELSNLRKGAPWIFITGENGFGKTSVLQAIASSLAGFEGHLLDYFREDVKPRLFCKLHDDQSFELSKETRNKFAHPSKNEVPNFKYIACYGSSRLDTYTESSTAREAITLNLYDSQTLLENIEYQLSRWFAKQEDKEFEIKYKKTKDLLIDILQLKDIKVDFKTDQVTYIEKDNQENAYRPLPIRQLASGYRSLIAMIGDMILRLFRSQKQVLDPKELEGIVIIDELDLHFHPKWQKRLPEIFSKHFPKIQFIASTHSPIPLLGAPEGSIFLTVQRSKETGVTLERLNHMEEELETLTPNLLLNSPIFGYAEVLASRKKSKKMVKTEDSLTEVSFNDQVKKSLEEDLSPEKRAELRKLISKE